MKVLLTPTEQLYFNELKNAGNVGVLRNTLSVLQPPPPPRSSNLVDGHIKNLRTKLKSAGYEIVTLRGTGYQLKKL